MAASCSARFFFVVPQFPGHVVSGSLAEEEAAGLNDRHQRKGNAHSARGAGGVQFSNEKGICHVVNGGNQHADDGGNRHFTNQGANGRLGHLLKFFFCTELLHTGSHDLSYLFSCIIDQINLNVQTAKALGMGWHVGKKDLLQSVHVCSRPESDSKKNP